MKKSFNKIKLTDCYRNQLISYHEAGHVFISFVNLIKVEKTIIKNKSRFTDFKILPFTSPSLKRMSACSLYAITLAGYVSECYYFSLNTGSKKIP